MMNIINILIIFFIYKYIFISNIYLFLRFKNPTQFSYFNKYSIQILFSLKLFIEIIILY